MKHYYFRLIKEIQGLNYKEGRIFCSSEPNKIMLYLGNNEYREVPFLQNEEYFEKATEEDWRRYIAS